MMELEDKQVMKSYKNRLELTGPCVLNCIERLDQFSYTYFKTPEKPKTLESRHPYNPLDQSNPLPSQLPSTGQSYKCAPNSHLRSLLCPPLSSILTPREKIPTSFSFSSSSSSSSSYDSMNAPNTTTATSAIKTLLGANCPKQNPTLLLPFQSLHLRFP